MSNEWLETLDDKIMEYWKTLAKEKYGINYEISFNQAQKEMQAIAQDDAQLRQFGSGSQGKPAEFWFEKLKNDFYRELSLDKIENQ